ncbi:hypothetical protein OG739_36400 [Streptomyces longwoodensis]|uniref:hypothetical protein n=1 Tax=Streptomyces longwoodensis TaxID=68231 RepID=UPI0022535565|nr:hypothetical protein [Streptomyces longwoodensis]MCX5000774.1 hypothetical protein [Streptomyces longwoodensis]
MTADAPQNLPASVERKDLVSAARADLVAFEEFMLTVLDEWGLPTDSIIVSPGDRHVLLKNTPDILNELDAEQLARSPYISKMIIAGAAGLFDAALSYLWDETITQLRDRVADFDVAYFFDLAEADPARRASLQTRNDLAKINDAALLDAAKKIQLISDVAHQQLTHINYMRNHASAAHPNMERLTGLKLADWLQTCIREVMQLKTRPVVAEIGRLLHNVKAAALAGTELKNAATFFGGLPQEQANNLANGLFGIYTPPAADPHVLDNVRLLWPELWPLISEDTRRELGVKLARFRANADKDRADRAKELLELVDGGAAYLPESDRLVEIQEALDDLMRAHQGTNNFYNEPPVARRLRDVVGRHGEVPTLLTAPYVATLVNVFLTNGYGVAWNAEPYYIELIKRFDGPQAAYALRSFAFRSITPKLDDTLPQTKWAELVELVAPKLTERGDRVLLELVRSFTGTPDKLRADSKIAAQLKVWREARGI